MEERLQTYKKHLEEILSSDDHSALENHILFLREQISYIENLIIQENNG